MADQEGRVPSLRRENKCKGRNVLSVLEEPQEASGQGRGSSKKMVSDEITEIQDQDRKSVV